MLLLATFVVYVASTLIFSLRYWLKSNRLIAAGVAAGGMAFAFHTALLLLERCLASGRLPLSNLYEFTLIFAWATILTFMFCAVRFRMLAAAPLALTVTTVLMGIAAMMPRDIRPLMPALRSVWLQAHVITGVLGYGALAVSAVLALAYLAGMGEKKAGEGPAERTNELWGGQYWRLPEKTELEGYIHGLIVFGFVFLSLLIVYRRGMGGRNLGTLVGLGPQGSMGACDLVDLSGLSAWQDAVRLEGKGYGLVFGRGLSGGDVHPVRRHLPFAWSAQLPVRGAACFRNGSAVPATGKAA